MDYDDRYEDEEDDRASGGNYGYEEDYDDGDYDDPYPESFDRYGDDEVEDDRWQVLRRFPRVPLARRAAALGIDAVVVGVPSSLGSGSGAFIGFVLLWLILRVIVVAKNQGQSLGRWALDMRVIDTEFGRSPGLLPLCKREALLGIATFLGLEAIVHLGSLNAAFLLAIVPLGLDGVLGLLDTVGRQTFHDRIGNTYVVHSRRGYSLDLRIKNLLSPADRRPF